MHYRCASVALSLLMACDTATDVARVPQPGEAPHNGRVADESLPPGTSIVESFGGGDDAIPLPYTKYRLENGLSVILHEDHSDPLVHIDVTYHVGSGREQRGRTGFAHFYEHMMFQGSAHVGDEEHSRTVLNAGGDLNGVTSEDSTTYYETLPANQLETALWLEADRMGFLLPAVTREKFENQRATVKNERAQTIDNVPYERTFETIYEHLYPEGHPYSWPTIGWTADLDRAQLEDLRNFFLRWYGPNNAVLGIGGDLDPVQTLAYVSKYFAPLLPGPAPERMPPQPAQLDADRYVTLEDNIDLSALNFAFPTVYPEHPDRPALDAAAALLGDGQASLLYRRLVETGRASIVGSHHVCRELACEFVIRMYPLLGSGESLAGLEAKTREALLEFVEAGVSDADLEAFRGALEYRRVTSRESVAGKLSELDQFETLAGDPKRAALERGRYAAVTGREVVRVARQYLTQGHAVVLSVVQPGQTQQAARLQDHDAPPRSVEPAEALAPLPDRLASDDFDRSVRPEPGQLDAPAVAKAWETQLDNGVRVLGVHDAETPLFALTAVFDVGYRDEPPGKAGIVALTVAMLEEASMRRGAPELARTLDRLGATLTLQPGPYEIDVALRCLPQHVDQALELMLERLLEPAFLAQDFERARAKLLDDLNYSLWNPQLAVIRATGAALYGADHPLANTGIGLSPAVESLRLQDVVAFYEEQFVPHLRGIAVSSGGSQGDAVAQLRRFGELQVAPQQRGALPPPRELNEPTLFLVDQPGAAQSTLRFAQHAMPYDALGDYYEASLANFPFGEAFNSRINLNLREDKGYTYDARSAFLGGPEVGSFQISADVSLDVTAAAIREVFAELERYDEQGMQPTEYDFLQSAILQRDALIYEPPSAKLDVLLQALAYELPVDYREQQQLLLRATDRATLNAVMSKALQPDRMAIVVVTDTLYTRRRLEALGFPIVDLDGPAVAPL